MLYVNYISIKLRKKVKKKKRKYREGHVKTEAETGDASTTKECLGPPEAGRGKEGSTPRTFGGSIALPSP